jgi:hypothetical protein
MSYELRPVDVAHAVLIESGRPDLAEIIEWWDWEENGETGGFIEVNDDVPDEDDWEVINRAEELACKAFDRAVPERASA